MENISIILSLKLAAKQNPYLSDIFNILHDFELSYNLSIVLTSPEYLGYKFSHYFFFRNRLKLKDEHRIRLSKITMEPIQITLIIPVHSTTISMTIVKALNILLNIIEEASTKPLKREKEKQEIGNLKKDITFTKTEIEELLEKRGAKSTHNSLVSRIGKNPTKIVEIKIQAIDNNNNNLLYYSAFTQNTAPVSPKAKATG